MRRVIEELRPSWVVGENVAGIVSMALDTVLSELESIGYSCQAFIIPACAVKAPHRRDRCAIVAYSGGERQQERNASDVSDYTGHCTGRCDPAADMADSNGVRLEETGTEQQTAGATGNGAQRNAPDPVAHSGDRKDRGGSWKPGQSEKAESGRQDFGSRVQENGSRERRITESLLGGMAYGLPPGMDFEGLMDRWDREPVPRIVTGAPDKNARLKALGNAVVPLQFYPIFKAIADIERMNVNWKS